VAEVTDVRLGGPVGAEVGAVALEGWVGEEGRVGGGEVVKVVRIGEGLDEFELDGESVYGCEWMGEEGSGSGSGGRKEGGGRGYLVKPAYWSGSRGRGGSVAASAIVARGRGGLRCRRGCGGVRWPVRSVAGGKERDGAEVGQGENWTGSGGRRQERWKENRVQSRGCGLSFAGATGEKALKHTAYAALLVDGLRLRAVDGGGGGGRAHQQGRDGSDSSDGRGVFF